MEGREAVWRMREEDLTFKLYSLRQDPAKKLHCCNQRVEQRFRAKLKGLSSQIRRACK
jgi:hypothetical protein